ncbi:Type-1 restriction enzyme R protein [Calidithermus terrae]|uniref:Type I restriction enzyme endonuclease subunit n=1 Tax=Calidithermus terrae TaxID=1408545 RepID=A0A399EXF9_9DEIN|nr:HsdR family type I site-specific deoxyribonuclease [Calidithermus terrae]RIH88285.1 Type-1 restriction enzyme R protein [Calidithermus terrae]
MPDVVLFVNGLPLVVVECKSPDLQSPLEEAIRQLRRYSNQRGFTEEEGAERLFHSNLLLVASSFYQARYGVLGAEADEYLEWKDTFPQTPQQVMAELGKQHLHPQQVLVAGLLRPATLLDLLYNFTLFRGNQKLVPRYPQYRAVHKALERLEAGQTPLLGAEQDARGGIIWHTQGSGKSLTMVYLVRVLRTRPELRGYKVVVITDRKDLENQLAETAKATGEPLLKAQSVEELKAILRQDGAGLVFGMIQKFQGDEGAPASAGDLGKAVLNPSEKLLVLVDEAHRSHTSTLHANLRLALPNAALIGFTGTPIVREGKKRTHEIFGPFIDTYTIKESQEDGATVPIFYEGRTLKSKLSHGGTLDALFEDLFAELSAEERQRLQEKYATKEDVLEAPKLIAAKARDMLRHYVSHVLPNGFKAQVVASSRLACMRYLEALREAKAELVRQLEGLNPAFLKADPEKLDPELRFLVQAHPHLEAIRAMEFAVVMSGGHNDPPDWSEWTDAARHQARIEHFKNPAHPLRVLIVKSMLLTGFDAPVEQVMYLDRAIRDHELLQAIARVNRVYPGKKYGLIVDYFGVANHLTEALAVYTESDLEGALHSIKDLLPKLQAAHHEAVELFRSRGVELEQREEGVNLLGDERLRAQFKVRLKAFFEALEAVLPRPEGLPYVPDAKRLGAIYRTAQEVYAEDKAPLPPGAGQKVRGLIDQYMESEGVSLKIAPVQVLDPGFEQAVGRYRSKRTQAAAMEHAARHYIRQHFEEDPVYYRKLSERLEHILQQYAENWEAQVEALKAFIKDLQAGRPADATGLDPKTQAPFFSLLLEANGGQADPERTLELAQATVRLTEELRRRTSVVDFWRNSVRRHQVHGWLSSWLDEQGLVAFEQCERVADELLTLAKHLRSRA